MKLEIVMPPNIYLYFHQGASLNLDPIQKSPYRVKMVSKYKKEFGVSLNKA